MVDTLVDQIEEFIEQYNFDTVLDNLLNCYRKNDSTTFTKWANFL